MYYRAGSECMFRRGEEKTLLALPLLLRLRWSLGAPHTVPRPQAASAGLVLVHVFPAQVAALRDSGYQPTGRHCRDSAFVTDGALTHVFQLPRPPLRRVACALRHRRDLCFWIGPRYSEARFARYLAALFGDTVAFELEQFDEYTCPNTGRQSRGFHVDLWSPCEALARAGANELAAWAAAGLRDGCDFADDQAAAEAGAAAARAGRQAKAEQRRDGVPHASDRTQDAGEPPEAKRPRLAAAAPNQ